MNRLALEIVGGVAAVVLLALLLGSQQAVGRLNDELTACGKAKAALASQIKSKAIEEGQAHEREIENHLAACRDAYDAGAKRLRDDRAISAGRYLPGVGAGHAGR